jgi:hypothetical protein
MVRRGWRSIQVRRTHPISLYVEADSSAIGACGKAEGCVGLARCRGSPMNRLSQQKKPGMAGLISKKNAASKRGVFLGQVYAFA